MLFDYYKCDFVLDFVIKTFSNMNNAILVFFFDINGKKL